MWAEAGRKLADSTVLPIDVILYARDLEDKFKGLQENYGETMNNHQIDLGKLGVLYSFPQTNNILSNSVQMQDALGRFSLAANELQTRIDELDKTE